MKSSRKTSETKLPPGNEPPTFPAEWISFEEAKRYLQVTKVVFTRLIQQGFVQVDGLQVRFSTVRDTARAFYPNALLGWPLCLLWTPDLHLFSHLSQYTRGPRTLLLWAKSAVSFGWMVAAWQPHIVVLDMRNWTGPELREMLSIVSMPTWTPRTKIFGLLDSCRGQLPIGKVTCFERLTMQTLDPAEDPDWPLSIRNAAYWFGPTYRRKPRKTGPTSGLQWQDPLQEIAHDPEDRSNAHGSHGSGNPA